MPDGILVVIPAAILWPFVMFKLDSRQRLRPHKLQALVVQVMALVVVGAMVGGVVLVFVYPDRQDDPFALDAPDRVELEFRDPADYRGSY